MKTAKIILVNKLYPLNLRPVVRERVEYLKVRIKEKGYDPSCPIAVQKKENDDGYVVINGCHRLQAVVELGLNEIPAIEYPSNEDPIRLALLTQENDENVQPWDFLDKAFLIKQLYNELGTLEAVAERLGWKGKAGVYHYINIANLPEIVFTEIRNSVNQYFKESVNDEVYARKPQYLDDLWKPTWFRHICALPTDELKIALIKKIAENPEKWKEKDVAAECAKLKKRYEIANKVGEILNGEEDCREELAELLSAVEKGLYDNQPEKAAERAEAVLKARRRTDLELMSDFGYEPQVFTVWKFNSRDERFGVEHPGNIPAGIIFNVLYYWTEQGDLVIDPMAGGGVTLDVCKVMKRRCLAWDVTPVREDIKKHNALDSWDVESGSASLVFLDPPYWKQKRGEYSGENNLADMDLEGFYKAMEQIFENAKTALKSGGHIAVIIGPTQENVVVYDHALALSRLLEETGYGYVNRIIIPYTTQQVSGFDVSQARKSKFMLKLYRDLLIYQKLGI